MTDTDRSAHQDRIAELQRRRAGSAAVGADDVAVVAPGGRRGAAGGSKVAAAGLGFAGMLGLVAAMGYAGRSSASEPQPGLPVADPPASVVVVIHPAADAPGADAPATGVAGQTPDASPTPQAGAPVVTGQANPPVGQPIVLSAQPTVRPAPAPVAAAPAGRTNGSR